MTAKEKQQRECIISLTNQNFALLKEIRELERKLENYEKFGVTCQTYRNHLKVTTCSECNC